MGVGVWISVMAVEESRVSLCIGLWLGISRSLAIVSVWEAIVRVDMGVGVWSIAVGEWSISMISISMSIKSRVVQPWVSLWISFSISLSSGLGNWLSLSLGNSFNGLSLGGSWSSSSG